MRGGPEAGGNGGELFSVAFASEGDLILSGGWDGHLRLWEVNSGAQVTALQAAPKAISACAVSPDGKQWLAGAMDGLLSCWDPATHRQLSSVLAHTRPISTIVFSPDGQELLTASWDCGIGLWDRVGERDRRSLIGHEDIVAGCRFTPDGTQILSWSHDGTVRLWDLARGQVARTLSGHTDRVTAGAVSPDGQWVATGARDRVLTLWQLAAGRPERSVTLGGEVRACFFLPDGLSLVSIDEHGRLVLHAVPGLQQRQELPTRRKVQCADLAPDGRAIALGCEDGGVACIAVDGLDASALLVTPTETTRETQSGWQKLFGGRRVTQAYACTCPICRHAFELPPGALGQPASCPGCRRALRLSPVARPAAAGA
jgi:WD40 repeat protein